MIVQQTMRITAKSGTSITLTKFVSGSPVAFGDGEAHPKYLALDQITLTTTNSPFDSAFYGCPGMFQIEIQRLT